MSRKDNDLDDDELLNRQRLRKWGHRAAAATVGLATLGGGLWAARTRPDSPETREAVRALVTYVDPEAAPGGKYPPGKKLEAVQEALAKMAEALDRLPKYDIRTPDGLANETNKMTAANYVRNAAEQLQETGNPAFYRGSAAENLRLAEKYLAEPVPEQESLPPEKRWDTIRQPFLEIATAARKALRSLGITPPPIDSPATASAKIVLKAVRDDGQGPRR